MADITKKIVLISTRVGRPGQEDKWKVFREIIPEAEIINIIDDSLVAETRAAGKITPNVIARLSAYYRIAEMIGADLIYNQCSVTGEASEVAAQVVNIPVVREDAAMAEKAAAIGGRIAVAAPMAASLEPSCDGIRAAAQRAGTNCEITPWLMGDAPEIEKREGAESSYRYMAGFIAQRRGDADVIVLAQGNLGVLVPLLGDIGVPVLTSSEMGIQKARQVLFEVE
jgi:hypothetical protein